MKLSLPALLVPFVFVACAVDPTEPEPETEPVENVAEAESELRALDDSKYCPPGEEVKCTLGPPPVCRCVPKDPPILPILGRW